eukprot:7190209-Pyramimonas_sp.AAC.1
MRFVVGSGCSAVRDKSATALSACTSFRQRNYRLHCSRWGRSESARVERSARVTATQENAQ